MRDEYNDEMNDRLENDSTTDSLENMLQSVYEREPVPQDIKIRLQNQLACRKAMETGNVSFWWLPATIMTVVSFAMAVFLCVLYVVININGTVSWMPNFLQFVSELWLRLHLMLLGIEVLVSWAFTLIGVWKGNLVKSARIL